MDYLVVKESTDRRCGKEGDIAAKIQRETWAMADELAGDRPSPTERTLADTAALSWLALRMAEYQAEADREATLSRALWRQGMIDRAHRRYVATLRTLAAVRKLSGPGVQVHVATQVNVAPGAVCAEPRAAPVAASEAAG